jgi:ribose transport system substrate-binding protein
MNTRFNGRAGGLAALALGATLALAACSSSSSDDNNSTPAASTPASTQASGGGAAAAGASAIKGTSAFNDAQLDALTKKIQNAIGSKSLSDVKIAMITNGTSSYWNEAKAGWDDAMKWLSGKGAKGEFEEPTKATASAQVSLLETLTTQGYTGWGVSAVTADSLTTPIKTATSKGLSVIAFDSPLPDANTQFYIGTPNTDAGCSAGKAMTQAIGSGDVVAISGSLTAANTQQRVAGFKKCMGSDVKISQTLNDGQDVPTAVSDLQAAIQANPDIKGIYGVYSYDGGAAVQAVKAANKTGKITIVSDDGEADTVAGVQSGDIAASILQRPYYQGYMLAYSLAADKALGQSAAMALIKPDFASPETLSTGVGVMTKANLSDFTDFWTKIGLKSQ